MALLAGLIAPAAHGMGAPLDVQLLAQAAGDPPRSRLASGELDGRFEAFDYREARRRGGPFWLRLQASGPVPRAGVPALVVQKGRHLDLQVIAPGNDYAAALTPATELQGFRGVHEFVYVAPAALAAGQPLYVRVEASGEGAEELVFGLSTLDEAVARSVDHERMIALAFGALLAMATAALMIWFVLADRIFLLYAALFSLQALYIAFVSGQGFAWPLLRLALPLGAHAWNVPAALSGAAACLFVREIADLRHYSPRVYATFGWLAVMFVALAFANLGELVGLGRVVIALGNLIFLATAVFTLVVAFLAWRRGSRAAGWFLLAWGLLEVMTIATAVSFLFGEAEGLLLYYGLPPSMGLAAVLVALGVADRLREQRAALSDAQRRAETDPLTGVLNRRSLVERLDAASVRAQTRGQPLALLFIDLDYFKEINDSHGHLAGDACLRAVISPIQAELRHSDLIGRYGGEEFVVILNNASEVAAHAIAERIRARVASLCVEGFGAPIQLTCSIGVATSDTLGVWGDHLIALADAAVYAAKSSGRNRVHVAAPVAASA